MANEPDSHLFTASDGLTIRYTSCGSGPPVVLVHSFGFDATLWDGAGGDGYVTEALVDAGRRAVAIDCRGHGGSDRPHDTGAYGAERLAADVTELLDHLEVDEVDVVTFSLGSYLALGFLQDEHRVRRAVVAGVGGAAFQAELYDAGAIPADPTTEGAVDLLLAVAPHLRARIEGGRVDPRALAAVLRGGFTPASKAFDRISASVLLLSGTRDDDPTPLAAVIPNSEVVRVDAGHGDTLDHPDFVPLVLRHLSS